MLFISSFLLGVMAPYLRGTLRPGGKEHGQGLVEYALILIFVGVVLVLLLTILGPGIKNIYANILQAIQNSDG